MNTITDTCDLCEEYATQQFEQGGECHTLCDACEQETRQEECAHENVDALGDEVWCEDCGEGLDSFDPEEVTTIVTPTFERGFALGSAAFADGRAAVPALDPAATGAVAGVPVGGAVEYWKGWLAGWHSANLLPTEEVAK